MPKQLVYKGIRPRQSESHTVISICAKASDIHSFASIDRIARYEHGSLKGFQRPQVASHIREIRQYLSSPDAVLPYSIVVAFTSDSGIKVTDIDNHISELSIPINDGPLGYVVDGQQRLTALAGLPEKNFDIFVSVLICKDVDELRKQFILINNTRALPKALIYELLPIVKGLPDRLTGRTTAAKMFDRLNYDEESSSLMTAVVRSTRLPDYE